MIQGFCTAHSSKHEARILQNREKRSHTQTGPGAVFPAKMLTSPSHAPVAARVLHDDEADTRSSNLRAGADVGVSET